MIKNIILLFLVFLFAAVPLKAQDDGVFCAPFDFELLLSGNFGELRSNHFHSGLDFKTQGAVGKPIKCVADGCIVRASVQPGGYGQALYVLHDNGYMTVYAHLDRFPKEIAKRVRDAQYGQESYSVDITFEADEFRVGKGNLLAYAGNSGYSFGPHLHFEVRDSTGNELYDPMVFYSGMLKDKRPPVASKVVVYPFPGAGVVDTVASSKVYGIKNGLLGDTIEAWGRVGFGIKALDYMDGTNDKYGVYAIELLVDDSLCFSSRTDHFAFSENRLINGWTDYSRYVNDGEWFQRLFVFENNPLRMLSANDDRGWIDIDEERLYKVECRLADYHGNTGNYVFNVRGKAREIPVPVYDHRLYWFLNNTIECDGMRLDVPAGELFEDAMLTVLSGEGEYGLSGRYSFGEEVLPFVRSARLSIKVDSLKADSSKLYIRRVAEKGGYAVGGKYDNGWVSADIGALGCFEVAVDTVAPRLVPVKQNAWMRNGKVIFAVSDKDTSVKSFRGTLNGNFILFSYNSKNGRMELDLKKENVRRCSHQLRLEVTDACVNVAVFEKRIDFK